MPENFSPKKAWIVDVSMGYGHQRTAYPLRFLSPDGNVIHVNDYQGMSEKDRKTWETGRKSYEFISNFKKVPFLGPILFGSFDKFQKILNFYPKRNLSEANLQLKQDLALVKKGCGRDLIEKLSPNPLPFITTFFTPAHIAEFFNYPGDIYCVVCDADISRTWAPEKPAESKIKYFTPNSWTTNRLKLYGVKPENIIFTGYPLPMENIGTEKMEILKEDLKERLVLLDPQKSYSQKYKILIDAHLGQLPEKPNRLLTLMFAVGGVGAQKEIAIQIVKSLKLKIQKGEMKLILVAGTRKEVMEYFIRHIERLGLGERLGTHIEILFAPTIEQYFKEFNLALRRTDILWTKPSELSFYTALGLPFIIAPPIGSQEDFNQKWLLALGSGILQENPLYAHQWLFDFLESGRLAEAAMQGFIEAENLGTLRIQKIISKER